MLRQRKEVTSAGYIRPMGCHRFGWIDGISMSVQKLVPEYPSTKSCAENTKELKAIPPLSILLRAESDDPWASDVHTLDLYVLHPNPDWHPTDGNASTSLGSNAFEIHDRGPEANYKSSVSSPRESPEVDTDTLCTPLPSPYLFPPVLTASWASTRGHLRCRDILVGPCGTALWIQPKPARNVGLTAFDLRGSLAQGSHEGEAASEMGKEDEKERVVAVVLPGMLKDSGTVETVRTLYAYEGAYGMWRCVDYDEARGWIALGDSQGRVEILELGRTHADAYRDVNQDVGA
ncbi:hypothetical protein EIP86_011438 [Pleurotus ostreatoroseus]|nr:hypothetical protein EIP86_011438 [Pleurotus ostreatoroseus]